jgi:hypothetical protein
MKTEEELIDDLNRLTEALRTAEATEAASRDAHAKAKQEAGFYRQQLHFARMRLSKAAEREARATALARRIHDTSLTAEERAAAKEAYFRVLEGK